MPSGAKKRKAAKKKKELESHNQNHNQQPHSDVSQINGDDDLKRHDGKESEGEDVNSPSSHDLANHQHQFTDEEKEEVGRTDGSAHVQLSSAENKFTEETKKNGVAVQKTVLDDSVACEELKTVVEFNNTNTIVEHVGSQKESGDGFSSQTLNEESAVKVESESKLFEKLDKNAAVQDIEHEKESGEGGLLQSDIDETHVIDKIYVVVDNAPFASSTEATSLLPEGLTQVPNPVPVGEIYGSAVESGMNTVSDDSGPVREKLSIDSVTYGDSFVPVKQGIDENWKKEEAGALDQRDTSFLAHEDSGLEKKNDEAIAINDAVGVSDTKNSTTQESKEMFLSDITRGANLGNANNCADCIKHLEVHEFSDNQPLLGSAAQPVQRTSWMSCCGLLEVLAGSNR